MERNTKSVSAKEIEKEIDDIFPDAINVQAIGYDWSKGYGEDGQYECWEAEECPECGRVLVVGPGETRCGDAADEGEDKDEDEDAEPKKECDGTVNAEGPQMSAYWPLPEFRGDESRAEALAPFPLALVHFTESDEWAIALTGGGMDLSWEIAGAYIAMGYCPPVSLRLPQMAGMVLGDQERRVLAACRKSAEVAKRWADNNLRDLEQVEKSLKAESAKKPGKKRG